MTVITTAELAAKALDLLREHKWLKGEYEVHDDAGGLVGACLYGAFGAACASDLDQTDSDAAAWPLICGIDAARTAVLDKIREQYGDHWATIENWNDNPSRTFPEVEAILEKVIAQ